MTKISAMTAAIVLAVGGITLTPASAAEVALSAHLMGSATSDPDGMGHATLKVDAAKSQICYSLMVEGIAPATMAHIHKGAAAASGPVAVPLISPDPAGKSAGCATADAAVVADILANPGGYYVNVHNTEFRAFEVGFGRQRVFVAFGPLVGGVGAGFAIV
eukprot:gene32933-55491_t